MPTLGTRLSALFSFSETGCETLEGGLIIALNTTRAGGKDAILDCYELNSFTFTTEMSSFDSKRGPPEIEGMTSLKVDNLTYRTTIGDLEHVFSKYGELGDVYIPRDRYKQESRGFAFVRFYERRDAEDAMDSLHGKVIDGREIRVQMAKYGRPTDPYKPRNNRYRSSYSSSSRYRSRSRSPKRR